MSPAGSSAPIVSFRGVTKRFGSKVVYEDCTLDVFPGETLTIIGGSGTGKSVLLKMLTGLLPADSGSILAFGQEVTALSERELLPLRKRVAMLFQSGALFDSLTVADNIKFPLREHGFGSEEEMDARVAEVLGMVGMPRTEHLKPSELSGGMRKRVGLARSIAIRPDVILYDEPTTGLDPINIRRINGLILGLQKQLGVTSIVVTHDMDTVFTVSDRVAMLHERRIAFSGTLEETRSSEIPWLRRFIQGGRGVLEDEG
jgi:phospholipid/cholesterol/gamma-HCH transport system ATP-binding protein